MQWNVTGRVEYRLLQPTEKSETVKDPVLAMALLAQVRLVTTCNRFHTGKANNGKIITF